MAEDLQNMGDQLVTIDRRNGSERRDRAPAAETENQQRRKTNRRRHIDPTTCEREYDNEEIHFMQAMDAYKRRSGRMFPTCSEVLEVIRELGYVRLTPEQKLELFGSENA